jgi:hypothetical protein
MHVKNMQKMTAYVEVSTEHSAFFPAGDAQIDVTDQFERPPAQRHVAVHATPMFSRLANCVPVSEMLREIVGLMILNRTALVAYDLLQSNDVGDNFCEYTSGALDANPAIEPPALVNIVSRDTESSHCYA